MHIGTIVSSPWRVDLSSIQLLDASYVPFHRRVLAAQFPSWLSWIGGACDIKALSCQMSLVHEGDRVWSWFHSKETTSNPAVHREQEEDNTLICHKQSIILGEKKAKISFLSKDAQGLLFFPRGELIFQECSSQKLVL